VVVELAMTIQNPAAVDFRGSIRRSLSTGGLGRALTTLARRRRCRWNSRLVSTTRSPNPRKWPIIKSLPKALINAANHIRTVAGDRVRPIPLWLGSPLDLRRRNWRSQLR